MKLACRTNYLFILLLILSSLCVVPAEAITLQTIKEKRVLLILEQTPAAVGDLFLASDENGKKKALIEITQVKNGKALGQITKGELSASPASYTLKAYRSSHGGPAKRHAGRSGKSEGGAWGYLFGMSQNNMSVKISDSSTVKMSGSSFNLEGFYEKVLDGKISAMGRFGYDNLKVTGTSDTNICSGGTVCDADIGYLAVEGIVRYNLRGASFDWWVGGGMGFLFALSKKSSVIDTSKISTNQKIMLVTGVDYNLSSRTFIPFQFDYALYPNNSTVTANQIIVRLGYGMRF